MVVAVLRLVMKLTFGCIGLALCAIDAPAWGQSSAVPEGADAAEPPTSVPAAPQSREEAPQSAPDLSPGLTWGDRQPSWRAPPQGAPNPALLTKTSRAWYGRQLLVSDAISLSLIGLGFGLDSQAKPTRGDAWVIIGAAAYAFAPPIIHLAHGRPGMAVASLSLRVMLPLTAALLGNAAQNCSNPEEDSAEGLCRGAGSTVGLLLGLGLTSAIDSVLFAWDKPEPEPETFAALSFGVAPVLSPDGKRAELRAFGTF